MRSYIVIAALLAGCTSSPEVLPPTQSVDHVDLGYDAPDALVLTSDGSGPGVPLPHWGAAQDVVDDPDAPCVTAAGCPDERTDYLITACDGGQLVTCSLDPGFRCYAHKTRTDCPPGQACVPGAGCVE